MMINKDEYETNKKLNKIKDVYIHFLPTQCECCGNYFVKEKMFRILNQYSPFIDDYNYYCKKCTPTKLDVLHKIDNEKIHRYLPPPRKC